MKKNDLQLYSKNESFLKPISHMAAVNNDHIRRLMNA